MYYAALLLEEKKIRDHIIPQDTPMDFNTITSRPVYDMFGVSCVDKHWHYPQRPKQHPLFRSERVK